MGKIKEIHFFNFDRGKTDVAKGVAILMMIWLHAFSSKESMNCYTSLLTIDGCNIELVIAKACNPVGLFMVLSGYGLYLSFLKGCGNNTLLDNMRQTASRTLRMYIPWWITLAFAVMVPSCLAEADFSLLGILENVTAWRATWNQGGWYIMPFVFTSILLNVIFPSFKKHTCVWISAALIAYYGVNVFYGKYWSYLNNYFGLKIFCRIFEFLLPMLLGALAAKYKSLSFHIQSLYVFDSLFFHVGIVCMFAVSIILGAIPMYPVYCLLLVLFIVNARYFDPIENVLSLLGQHSLNIWFIHPFFIRAAYRLEYSPIIFIALLMVSFVLSIVVNKLAQPIMRKVLKNKANETENSYSNALYGPRRR